MTRLFWINYKTVFKAYTVIIISDTVYRKDTLQISTIKMKLQLILCGMLLLAASLDIAIAQGPGECIKSPIMQNPVVPDKAKYYQFEIVRSGVGVNEKKYLCISGLIWVSYNYTSIYYTIKL